MTSNADDSEIDGSQLSVSNITQGSEGHQNEPNDDLDSELMSDFSKLQINSSDCLRTFSPIGSERTSPDQQENFLDSNEDINNLLAPHENDNIEDDVLSTGNARTDNLLKEITGEGRSYKSAELFSVNPSELENEFQEGKTPNEDLSSGEKAEDVIAILKKMQKTSQRLMISLEMRHLSQPVKPCGSWTIWNSVAITGRTFKCQPWPVSLCMLNLIHLSKEEVLKLQRSEVLG